MTGKIYKSAMGKHVDLGALILNNENTRAVGNMGVNARGDVLDSGNKVIEPKNRQVQKQYARMTRGNVPSTDPVVTSTKAAAEKRESANRAARTKTQKKEEQEEQEVVVVQEQPQPVSDEPAMLKSRPAGGLAAAIAKSQEIKQEKLMTARQRAQEQQGVKKI